MVGHLWQGLDQRLESSAVFLGQGLDPADLEVSVDEIEDSPQISLHGRI